ncbi:MAG: GntR family transcriptional regulator [Acidobacteria bacterium]|nr:GntR family transcriptional regulator [Acidobacteriota bacterium]
MNNGLEIRVVLNSSTPVYRQVADAIRAHCVAGRLAAGTKLPTVRELAASLGIHFNTVAEAYRVLSDEGWLRIEGRRGATVMDRQQPRMPSVAAQAVEGSRLRHLIAELRAKGLSQEWIWKEMEAALETK